MKKKVISPINYNNSFGRVADILLEARNKVVREINKTHVLAYWEIGREIVEFEQGGKKRGEYGEQLIEKLSRDMTQKFGRGFSTTNLKMMRLFYQAFPIRQTLSDESKKSKTLSGKSICDKGVRSQHLTKEHSRVNSATTIGNSNAIELL